MAEEKIGFYSNLLVKFFTGEISDNEMVLLKTWLEQDPENRRIFDKQNELWQEVSVQAKPEYYKTEAAWSKILSKLGFGKNNYRSVTLLGKNNYRILLAAASLAFLVTIGSLSLWIKGKYSLNPIIDASIMIVTNKGERAHIFLPDSTEIILNSESTIQYNRFYNINDRIVKLTGEAFFNVSTNPEQPFIVKLDKMSISATGTRFNVFSFDNEDRIETTLVEGHIQISTKDKNPISLKSGQQAVYFSRSEKIIVGDVATDTYTSWMDNKLRLNDTPFEEALRRIARKYNVKFEITNLDLLDMKYTATFIDESIEEVMGMLKAVSPITYRIYNRTSVNDKEYLNPRIVVGKRRT